MIILNCSNISFSFGTETVLKNISFSIKEYEKLGLVGVNGAGKTTLLKIITGEFKQDTGSIHVMKDIKIGYLKQDLGLCFSNSIWNEVLSVYTDLITMEKQIRTLESKISSEKNRNIVDNLIKKHDDLCFIFERCGGYEYNSRAKGVLKGLGFDRNSYNQPVSSLSGGQKTRLALAKLLLRQPDILLLDEPTNHLDINSTEWLEDFLKNYKKSILVISHDRYFLDNVTNKTLELENHICKLYNGNYSEYIKRKRKNKKIEQKHYELQQKEISHIKAFIEKQKQWNREKNLIAARSRQKVLDKMDKLSKPAAPPEKINIKFKSGISSGRDVLFVDKLSKSFSDTVLFDNISFNIMKNERIFLLGPNGCGKTTLLKILAGSLNKTAGSIRYGHNVKIGYYDQEQESLNFNKTVIEEVWDSNNKLTHTEIRNILAMFLIRGEDVFKSINSLSGGEKSRAALAKLMASGANFLLMDEPTNHLDINSKECLESALMNFDGTVLIVSHDRYFISKIGTRIMKIHNNSLTDYKGNYSGYIKHKNNYNEKKADTESDKSITDTKLAYIASKEKRSKLAKLKKRLKKTEEEIYSTEASVKQIENEMKDSQIQSDHVALQELHDNLTMQKKKLDNLYTQWDSLTLRRERAKQ